MNFYRSELINCNHRFFTRNGGVSEGFFNSLNFSRKSGDLMDNINENILIAEKSLGVKAQGLKLAQQKHTINCLIVDSEKNYEQITADALIAKTAGIAVGVITADCAPILIESDNKDIVAAIHAGWRGAFNGVIEATITMLKQLSNSQYKAVIGPCIQQHSYEVDINFYNNFINSKGKAVAIFFESKTANKYNFNLPAYCKYILNENGILKTDLIEVDTVSNPNEFFSYRRKTLLNEPDFGCQLSAIKCS